MSVVNRIFTPSAVVYPRAHRPYAESLISEKLLLKLCEVSAY